jgi:hypothetical protein
MVFLRRGIIVLLVIAVLVTGMFLEIVRRNESRKRLVAEIKAAGGPVDLGSPPLDRLIRRLRHAPYNGTSVTLVGPTFDGKWLQERDNLAGLDIDNLILQDSPLSDAELAALLDEHPITYLWAENFSLNTQGVAALARNKTLRLLYVPGSDLEDTGFAALPLEQLTEIHVANTRVTAKGLLAVKRCRQLDSVFLDGKQFDREVAAVLHELENLDLVGFVGPTVTDDDAALAQKLTRIERMNLIDTSVTAEAVDALKKALPECDVDAW